MVAVHCIQAHLSTALPYGRTVPVSSAITWHSHLPQFSGLEQIFPVFLADNEHGQIPFSIFLCCRRTTASEWWQLGGIHFLTHNFHYVEKILERKLLKSKTCLSNTALCCRRDALVGSADEQQLPSSQLPRAEDLFWVDLGTSKFQISSFLDMYFRKSIQGTNLGVAAAQHGTRQSSQSRVSSLITGSETLFF